MSDVCTWPSCKCTAKGQCEGLGYRILAPTFTAADLERAWQPIETAPKDGTMFLAWFASRNNCSVAWWRKHTIDGDLWASFLDVYPERWSDKPTHWMPLPPPPADLAQRVKE